MLPHIPYDYKNGQYLRDRLGTMQDVLNYTAPEDMTERWRAVASILSNIMGPPPFRDQWKTQVYNIWMSEE